MRKILFTLALLSSRQALGDSKIDAAAAVPEVFAMEAIGAPDLKPIRPGSLQTALTDLRGVVKDGKWNPGFALEVSPWELGQGAAVTWGEYAENATWLRSSLSVATVGSADPAVGVLGALALRVRIADETDWRLNKPFLACADAKLKSALDSLPPPPAPGTSMVTSPPTAPRPDYASCLDKVAWNADQAAVAAAATFASTSSSLSDTRADGLVAWFGASRGIGRRFQLVGNLKYHFHRASSAAAELHQASIALRGEYKSKYFGVSADAGYGPAFQSGNVSHRGLFGIFAHVRVAETSYAEVGLQDDLDWSAGTGKLSVTSNFKLSFAIPR